jgi:hypothetical protein
MLLMQHPVCVFQAIVEGLLMKRGVCSILAVTIASPLLGYLAYSAGYFVKSKRLTWKDLSPSLYAADSPPQVFQPYFASRRTTRLRSDGVPGHETSETFWRRRDGSTVHIYTARAPLGEERQQVREFVDVPSRKDVYLEPFTKSAITIHLSAADIEQKRRRESPACIEKLGPSTETGLIMGAGVLKVRESTGGMNYSIDSWVAPQLGCLVLQETAVNPSGARNTVTIDQLSLVDPPDDLFQVPVDYTEHSPIEVERLYEERFPGKKLYGDDVLKRAQQHYHLRRGN